MPGRYFLGFFHFHANEYNVGELIKAFVNEGGDTGFMSVLNIDPAQQGSTASIKTDNNEVVNTSSELTESDINVEQAVADSIQNNVQADPEGVQTALTEGMGVLLYLEVRPQSDSGNINYAGFKADATSNAYVDFITKRGSMEGAVMVMAGDISSAIATGQLSAGEVSQLQGVLAGLIGSADLAEAYVANAVDGRENSGYNITKWTGNFGSSNLMSVDNIDSTTETNSARSNIIDYVD